MELNTFMNLIFSLIIINLALVGIVSVLSIKALKQYQTYIDEKELEEIMRKIVKENKNDTSVGKVKTTRKTN